MLLSVLLIGCGAPEETEAPPEPPPSPTGDTAVEAPAPPLCAPEATLPTDHVVEGDTYTVTLGCVAPGAVQGDFVASLVEGPAGADFDPATWAVTVPTDLDDAGPQTLFFEVRHGAVPGLPETLEVQVAVSDAGPGVPGNVPPDPSTYRTELGLPVLHLLPSAPLTEEYVLTTTWIGGEEQRSAEMKLRGASSLSYPKNSFTVKAQPSDAFELQELGLGKRDRLVLVSTFDDNSYVRQKLVYDLWEDMAAHFALADRPAPHASFVVVYLSGAYHGLYVAIDHIDEEYFADFGLSELGNVYKSVNHDANFMRTLASGSEKTDLTAGWEKKEGLPEWDTSDLEALTAFAADSDPATFWDEAPGWIDVEAFQDWFLLVSFSAAADSAGKNAYLYHRLGPTEIWRYTPWDMNHAWGQSWTTERTPVDQYDDFRSRNQMFAHFHDHPAASDVLWARYDSLAATGGPLTADHLLQRLADYREAIEPSARRDQAVWGAEYASFERWSDRTDLTDLDGEWAYLEQWLADRPAAFATHRP